MRRFYYLAFLEHNFPPNRFVMSEIVTQLFSDLAHEKPCVIPKSMYHLFALRRIVAECEMTMIPKVEPTNLRLLLEDVFDYDGVINWGRILVVYKFVHIYSVTYPDQRINARIIILHIMIKKLKPWILKNLSNRGESFIASMFTFQAPTESCYQCPWMPQI
jgi:hypothetical protein